MAKENDNPKKEELSVNEESKILSMEESQTLLKETKEVASNLKAFIDSQEEIRREKDARAIDYDKAAEDQALEKDIDALVKASELRQEVAITFNHTAAHIQYEAELDALKKTQAKDNAIRESERLKELLEKQDKAIKAVKAKLDAEKDKSVKQAQNDALEIERAKRADIQKQIEESRATLKSSKEAATTANTVFKQAKEDFEKSRTELDESDQALQEAKAQQTRAKEKRTVEQKDERSPQQVKVDDAIAELNAASAVVKALESSLSKSHPVTLGTNSEKDERAKAASAKKISVQEKALKTAKQRESEAKETLKREIAEAEKVTKIEIEQAKEKERIATREQQIAAAAENKIKEELSKSSEITEALFQELEAAKKANETAKTAASEKHLEKIKKTYEAAREADLKAHEERKLAAKKRASQSDIAKSAAQEHKALTQLSKSFKKTAKIYGVKDPEPVSPETYDPNKKRNGGKNGSIQTPGLDTTGRKLYKRNRLGFKQSTKHDLVEKEEIQEDGRTVTKQVASETNITRKRSFTPLYKQEEHFEKSTRPGAEGEFVRTKKVKNKPTGKYEYEYAEDGNTKKSRSRSTLFGAASAKFEIDKDGNETAVSRRRGWYTSSLGEAKEFIADDGTKTITRTKKQNSYGGIKKKKFEIDQKGDKDQTYRQTLFTTKSSEKRGDGKYEIKSGKLSGFSTTTYLSDSAGFKNDRTKSEYRLSKQNREVTGRKFGAYEWDNQYGTNGALAQKSVKFGFLYNKTVTYHDDGKTKTTTKGGMLNFLRSSIKTEGLSKLEKADRNALLEQKAKAKEKAEVSEKSSTNVDAIKSEVQAKESAAKDRGDAHSRFIDAQHERLVREEDAKRKNTFEYRVSEGMDAVQNGIRGLTTSMTDAASRSPGTLRASMDAQVTRLASLQNQMKTANQRNGLALEERTRSQVRSIA